MKLMNSATHHDASNDFGKFPIDLEQPGFFQYARFAPSSSQQSAKVLTPLSLNPEPVIWPTLMASN